jgi:S-adenosylmethionine/arginine decarboxylase-like enzyme
MDKKPFEAGKQIKIICSDCLIWNLNNWYNVNKLLVEMCSSIEMMPLGGPYTAEVKEDDGNGINDGISGVLIIKTSHISLHCWNYWKAARITVDSCEDFDEQNLIDLLVDRLLPANMRIAHEIWDRDLI